MLRSVGGIHRKSPMPWPDALTGAGASWGGHRTAAGTGAAAAADRGLGGEIRAARTMIEAFARYSPPSCSCLLVGTRRLTVASRREVAARLTRLSTERWRVQRPGEGPAVAPAIATLICADMQEPTTRARERCRRAHRGRSSSDRPRPSAGCISPRCARGCRPPTGADYGAGARRPGFTDAGARGADAARSARPRVIDFRHRCPAASSLRRTHERAPSLSEVRTWSRLAVAVRGRCAGRGGVERGRPRRKTMGAGPRRSRTNQVSDRWRRPALPQQPPRSLPSAAPAGSPAPLLPWLRELGRSRVLAVQDGPDPVTRRVGK